MPDMPLSVIIVAAGSARRMGFDKLAAPLAGRPVLWHSVNAFRGLPGLLEIIVVCPPERFALLDASAFPLPLRRCDGGAERADSVARGLEALSPRAGLVAVHDGARPLPHPEDLARCLEAAAACHAAALARPLTDTLKRGDEHGFCVGSVSREGLWRMETPQVFAVPLLKKACAAVPADTPRPTDEVSAVQALGHPIRFIEALHPNPKITRPADLPLAAALLAAR